MTRLWLNLPDNVQVRPYSGRELDFCLLWSVNECRTEERYAAGEFCECFSSTPSQYPNHLIENSLLASFHDTNVSFTHLNPFQSIYFACSGSWSMRGNVFLWVEEFSCENLTRSAASFSPSFPLCCQSQLFFKERGCEHEKSHKQTAERWKMLL